MLLSLGWLISVVFLVVLTTYSYHKIPVWSGPDRNFNNLLLTWKQTFVVSNVFAVIMLGAAFALGAQWWQLPFVSLLAWMLVFVSVTDYATYKIPSETSILAYVLPLPLVVYMLWGDKFGLISAGIWFALILLITVIGVLLMRGGLGFADVRLFILVGVVVSWWVGVDWMIYGFGGAALVQLAIHVIAQVFDLGRIKIKGEGVSLSKEESNEYKRNKKRIAEQKKQGVEDVDVLPSARKVLPFGPSIIGTFLVVVMLAIALDRNACSAYSGLFCL